MDERILMMNLHDILANRFSQDELGELCFRLGLDIELFTGNPRSRARQLIFHYQHRNATHDLIEQILRFRADVWEDLFTRTEEVTSKLPLFALDADVAFFDIERCRMADYYIYSTMNSSKVDIIALSSQILLDDYGVQRLMDWVMRDGKQFRILILAPDSAAVRLRGKEMGEEGVDLPEKIGTQIQRLKHIGQRANQLIAEGANPTGSIEVRVYDGLPYFAYFGTETEVIIGPYLAQKSGAQSGIFLVNGRSRVFRDFKSHFETVWRGDGTPPGNRQVCVIP